VANIATMIPEGMVVVLEPDPLVATKSGPQIEAIATAVHIAKMSGDQAGREPVAPALIVPIVQV
jgi:hypothetical protein